jgi:hypothetical protein
MRKLTCCRVRSADQDQACLRTMELRDCSLRVCVRQSALCSSAVAVSRPPFLTTCGNAALRTSGGGGDVLLESRENLDRARRGSWKVDRRAQGIEDPTQGSQVDTRRQVGC